MALYYDLPVYRDTYKLILKIFEYSKDFPDYKYTLGQDMTVIKKQNIPPGIPLKIKSFVNY
jgi:hypothetical protein